MDVVIITPEKGRHKEIGQQLLELAGDPRDVQWVTWPVAGFQVPLELFSAFKGETPGQEAVQEPEPVPEPKRRGRPRKQAVQDTDNNTSEEE